MPSATLRVSRTNATDPVPRVRYQYDVGLVIAAVMTSAPYSAQEPPETTGADEDGAGAGASPGCCRPLLELEPALALSDVELPLDDRAMEVEPGVL